MYVYPGEGRTLLVSAILGQAALSLITGGSRVVFLTVTFLRFYGYPLVIKLRGAVITIHLYINILHFWPKFW